MSMLLCPSVFLANCWWSPSLTLSWQMCLHRSWFSAKSISLYYTPSLPAIFKKEP